jgi:hypothetical protein
MQLLPWTGLPESLGACQPYARGICGASQGVITGTIKANFPTRISFQVTSDPDVAPPGRAAV